ncbi:hypothetical protein DI487_13350 [Flavobacterium sediminis]|uniref:Uncharacterized protein n=1 Tax=Flavobacterium sediminis TaxID=2201181 RepID=A0A2U8QXW1_9FLAO|nr:hypothetical protein [Flavobacterium sediminis]AWM14746.1 hypothetical protein DI487_13350 [Flavobacterium sediminis]
MKKLLLFIAFLCFSTSNAQINNLKELLIASELSLESLTEELQYDGWSIERPTEKFKDNGRKVVGTYSFTFTQKKQLLRRIIIMDTSDGTTFQNTKLIIKDKTLYNLIVKNLPQNGYSLIKKNGNESLYNDGRNAIMLTENYSQKTLGTGVYEISILLNAIE